MSSDRVQRAKRQRQHLAPLSPREDSKLPHWFTDAECAASVWARNKMFAFAVHHETKTVTDHRGELWPDLITFAEHHGWEGMK